VGAKAAHLVTPGRECPPPSRAVPALVRFPAAGVVRQRAPGNAIGGVGQLEDSHVSAPMRYFEMPARGVADDTQSASVNSPTTGARRSQTHWTRHLGGKQLRPGSIVLALSGAGGRVVCSDDENAHPL
jgi:hypothetical protein